MKDSALRIAIDLDGTISEYPDFFRILIDAVRAAGCRVYIVTDRPPGTESEVASQLAEYGIGYDTIKITGEKSSYILREGIDVLFDDVDGYFVGLPPQVAVFKIRQKYNFDFTKRQWL
jgi:hypothetical protein